VANPSTAARPCHDFDSARSLAGHVFAVVTFALDPVSIASITAINDCASPTIGCVVADSTGDDGAVVKGEDNALAVGDDPVEDGVDIARGMRDEGNIDPGALARSGAIEGNEFTAADTGGAVDELIATDDDGSTDSGRNVGSEA
jgi:hypothetical protein